ncbi:MAG: acylneuraminate cytidylyltransferase [Gammaproteobacteria bacterium]|nr:acylneuraminate cytidylyltransferase [Gammaproteobacteria bacterium]
MRRLVAALACRNNGSRLFGKPLQNLLDNTSILDQIVAAIRRVGIIDEIVLGISEGAANDIFVDKAHEYGIGYIWGDPQDVLMRLIQCGRMGRATDVFRVTTECPWFAYDLLTEVWTRHKRNGNDITVCDRLPEGINFEIYSLAALERSHANGSAKDRSEFCSNYARHHVDEFKIEVVLPPVDQQRMDLRVTVDYPEDLIVCREIAKACRSSMPLVSVAQIATFLDSRPDLKALVAPFVVPEPTWNIG